MSPQGQGGFPAGATGGLSLYTPRPLCYNKSNHSTKGDIFMPKRLFTLLLALVTLLALTAFPAAAEDATPQPLTSGNYQYIVLEDGTVALTKYTGKDGTLAIPGILDGKTVSRVGDEAFFNCRGLTSITIPDSVTSIGDRAFFSCSSLASITIPDSVTAIGANPFDCCGKLTDIQVSPDHPALAVIDGVLFSKADKQLVCYPYAFTAESYIIPQGIKAIGDYAFGGCTSLTSITIPNSVTSIGDFAFFSCHSLTSVTIPDSVTFIGDDAFSFCSSLAAVTIPDSVTSIGDHTFSFCSILTSITIPDSVTTIGANPFDSCGKLTDIQVSPDHPALAVADGVLFTKADQRLVCYPCAFTAESYIIPQGIKAIGDWAFSFCDNLTSITIPDSVTAIGDWAFFSCSNLTSVTIPDSVTSIGNSVFYDCSSLTSVTISDSVTSIGDNAFLGCNNLTSITIPDSVTFIGDSAFAECPTTLTLTVPRNSYAEQYCRDNGLKYTCTDAPD